MLTKTAIDLRLNENTQTIDDFRERQAQSLMCLGNALSETLEKVDMK